MSTKAVFCAKRFGRFWFVVAFLLAGILLLAVGHAAGAPPPHPSFVEHVLPQVAGVASPMVLAATDMDADGDMDLMVGDGYNGRLYFYESDGAVPPTFTPREISWFESPVGLVLTDLDQDGDPDVVTACSYTPDHLVWTENLGGSPLAFTDHELTEVERPMDVDAADLDGDGDIDLVFCAEYAGAHWLENDGNTPPDFDHHVLSATYTLGWGVRIVDINGDGDQDVAMAGHNSLALFESDGSATPTYSLRSIASPTSAYDLDVADIDGDGAPDLVIPSYDGNLVQWFENDGAATPAFTPHTVATGVPGARSVAAVDVDGDGDLDILSASFDGNKLLWHENDGATSPTFATHTLDSSVEGALFIRAFDLDNDGNPDPVVTAYASLDDSMAWYGLLPWLDFSTSPMLHHPHPAAILPCATAGVDVNVHRVIDLGAFEFRLAYPGGACRIASATGVTLGPFLGSTGNTALPVGPVIDAASESVLYGAYTLPSGPGPNGAGAIASLIWSSSPVVQRADVPLLFEAIQISNTAGDPMPVAAATATLTVCYYADQDCDDDVDIVDVQRVAGAWNTLPGDPKYAVEKDVDRDGDIDIVDIQRVAGKWNTVAPF